MATKDLMVKPVVEQPQIRDGALAVAVERELDRVPSEAMDRATLACAVLAKQSSVGSFDERLQAYRHVIRRAIHPERKVVRQGALDVRVLPNPHLRSLLDKELQLVSAEDIDRVHAAIKEVLALQEKHPETGVMIPKQYTAAEFPEVLRIAIRAALAIFD